VRVCPCEPVNHGAAGDQAQEERSVQQGKFLDIGGEAVGERHDNGENHGRRADDGGADQNRLCGCFKGVSCAVVGFEQVFRALEVDGDIEVFLEFRFDVGNLLNQRQLIHRLRIV